MYHHRGRRDYCFPGGRRGCTWNAVVTAVPSERACQLVPSIQHNTTLLYFKVLLKYKYKYQDLVLKHIVCWSTFQILVQIQHNSSFGKYTGRKYVSGSHTKTPQCKLCHFANILQVTKEYTVRNLENKFTTTQTVTTAVLQSTTQMQKMSKSFLAQKKWCSFLGFLSLDRVSK